MAARGPPPSLSVPPSYSQGGSGQSSDSFRTRGRNRSSGSSGPSSREHSVEGRGGDSRRGGVDLNGAADFRASYHNQYPGSGRRDTDKAGRGQHPENVEDPDQRWQKYPQFARETAQGVFGGGNLQVDPPPGVGNSRSNRSMPQHGRGQGGVHDEVSAPGVGSSPTITRGYSLTIKGDSRHRESQGQRNDSDYYGGGSRRTSRQENGYGPYGGAFPQGQGNQRLNGSQWQENAYGAGNGNRWGGGQGRLSMGAGWSGGISRGRHSGVNWGEVPEDVFGGGQDLQAFGSSSGLRRDSGASVSLRGDGRSSARYGRGGDIRRSITNEGVGREEGRFSNQAGSGRPGHIYSNNNQAPMQRANSEVIQNFDWRVEHQQQRQFFPGEERPRTAGSRKDQDAVGSFCPPQRPPSRGSLSSSSMQQSFENWSDFRDELVPSRSPSFTSSKGSYSRKSSVERRQRSEEESPVFTPSSVSRNGSSSLNGRSGRHNYSREQLIVSPLGSEPEASSSSAVMKSLSRESSVSESSRQEMEGWNAAAQLTSGSRGWGSTQGTRVTDWYEICLQEEEAEELQALAEKSEIKISAGREEEVLNSSRAGSSRGKHPDARELGNDRLGGGGAALDTTSRSRTSLSGGRNATPESAGTQMLFTPWNAQLQHSPKMKSGCLQINHGAKLQQHFRQSEKNPGGGGDWRGGGAVASNGRISIAGGRQAVSRGARRGAAEPERWRPDSKAQTKSSRDLVSRDNQGRLDVSREVTKAIAKESSVGGPAVEDATASEAILPQVVTGVRASAFYRAFNSADGGVADEDLLPHISGTCPDMCPAKERAQRERLRDLAVFERVSGDMRKTSKDLAVKKFCRTVVASELDQSDIRPLPVLWKTQQYLMGLLDDPEFAFDVIHNFLFDRTRAIRQELGMQRIDDHQSVTLYEEVVRFHILSHHELRNLNRKRMKQVDTHLNLQQLSKALHSLLNLYTRLGGRGDVFENEAEFHAYYVLLNLGNHGQFQAEPLSLWFPNVPSRLRNSDPVLLSRKALRLYRSNDYIGFFRLVTKASYLQSCLLELCFDSLRATALAAINASGYKMHPYPLSDLAHALVATEGDVAELCKFYGLVTGTDNSSHQLCLLPKQAQFTVPEREELPKSSCPAIDKKRASSFLWEVKGAAARGDGSRTY